VEDDMNEEEGGLLRRLRESPRTVSALIIILIVAAAIYAFSGGSENESAVVSEPTDESVAVDIGDNEETIEEDGLQGDTEESSGDEVASATPPAATPTPEPVELPEPSRTEGGYMEVANPGEGVTHLARKAAARWVEENQTDYDISKEHLVYIEDYIKDSMGSQPLTLGEEKEISFDLIAEAVGSAKDLSETQLKNLSKYTAAF